MNIPRYWVRATAEVPTARGRVWTLSAWGWSTTDRADAAGRARERLAALSERVRHGFEHPRDYAYGHRPPREEIVLEHRDGDGAVNAVVTRNGYGALVLNTADVLFVDVDVPPAPPVGLLSRMFGGARPDPADAALPGLRDALAASGSAFRLYRTAGGFRALGTDRTWDPRAESTHAFMERVGADPAFRNLCRLQESFRARLTPKPWRCGLRLPPGSHPRDGDDAARFATWLRDYEAATAPLATCRFVESVGGDRIAPAVRPIVEHHDAATRATAGLPLA